MLTASQPPLRPAGLAAPQPVLPALVLHPDWQADLLASVPAELRRAMLSQDAMRQRIMARLYLKLGIREPDQRAMRPDDRRILATLASAPQRFMGLAGLTWHARALGRAITPGAIKPLLEDFPPADIAIAVSLKLFAPVKGAGLPGSAAEARKSGERLVQAWAEAAGLGLDRIAALTMSKDTALSHPPAPVNAQQAGIILAALAYRMAS